MRMAGKLYFAYGSNINLGQMEQRCPAARPVCPVILDGYELRFREITAAMAWPPSPPERAAMWPGCCGSSRRSVSGL